MCTEWLYFSKYVFLNITAQFNIKVFGNKCSCCKRSPLYSFPSTNNPTALKKAKIVYYFGLSECNRVKAPKIVDFANSIDPDEVAHNELPHQFLACLPSSLFRTLGMI